MIDQFEFDLDVRYYETDAQGFVHHSNYFRYFELARVEMLKAAGYDYAKFEEDGYLLVVSKIGCQYRMPTRYGDTLRIRVTTERARGARIDHTYLVMRDGLVVAEGNSTIACVNRDGEVQRIPPELEKARVREEK